MWKVPAEKRENRRVVHRDLKNTVKVPRSPFLSTVRPHGINRLLWINFLFQDLNGISQGLILFEVRGDLVRPMDDGGMVPAAQITSDGLERGGKHVPAKVHGNLSGVDDFLGPLLGCDILRSQSEM